MTLDRWAAHRAATVHARAFAGLGADGPHAGQLPLLAEVHAHNEHDLPGHEILADCEAARVLNSRPDHPFTSDPVIHDGPVEDVVHHAVNLAAWDAQDLVVPLDLPGGSVLGVRARPEVLED